MTRLLAGTVVPFVVACILVGCATPGNVGDQVVKANLGQELAHNKLLLLNVVRAYRRMPMHFSKVTSIRLPLGVGNPTFTLPTPFGPDFTTQIYQLSTQVAIQQGVDSMPMDSQEFMRGITTPVTPSQMLYFLDQGWPQQLILHLFVRSIEIYESGTDDDGGDRLVDRLTNYPQNPTTFATFQEALGKLIGCEIDGQPDRSRTAYGPIYKAADLGNAEALAAAKSADLALLAVDATGQPTKNDASGYQFFKEVRFTNLRISQSPIENDRCERPGSAQLVAAQSDLLPRGAVRGKRTAVFVLRSPEAMLYYLGEIARAQIDGPAPKEAIGQIVAPTIRYRSVRSANYPGEVTLFQLRKTSDASSAVSVEHQGEVFSVPMPTPSDRSMHVLSLIAQLIALQNKGTDLPATTNVRLVQ